MLRIYSDPRDSAVRGVGLTALAIIFLARTPKASQPALPAVSRPATSQPQVNAKPEDERASSRGRSTKRQPSARPAKSTQASNIHRYPIGFHGHGGVGVGKAPGPGAVAAYFGGWQG